MVSRLCAPPTESKPIEFVFHPIDFAASIRIPSDSAVIEANQRELAEQLDKAQREQSNSIASLRAECAACEEKIAELTARRDALRRELERTESELTAVLSRFESAKASVSSQEEASQRAIDALQSDLHVGLHFFLSRAGRFAPRGAFRRLSVGFGGAGRDADARSGDRRGGSEANEADERRSTWRVAARRAAVRREREGVRFVPAIAVKSQRKRSGRVGRRIAERNAHRGEAGARDTAATRDCVGSGGAEGVTDVCRGD